VAAGRARVWLSRGDIDRAIEFQKQAVELTPHDFARSEQLAEIYEARDRTKPAKQTNEGASQPHSK
jgi:hypothetical protein